MNIPPLAALETLEALARTGSIHQAAAQVNLSASACSHKIKALEARLGFRLIQPAGRGITLTAEGRRYVAAVRPALEQLRDAHRGHGAARGELLVAVTSGFAATWLAPRIRRFVNLYPEIALTLSSTPSGVMAPTCDLQIAYARRPPKGAEPLLEVHFFPVCSPDFLYTNAGLTPERIAPDHLLHLESREDWRLWLASAGCALDPGDAGITFTGLLAMYAAAEAGAGIGLGDAVTSAHALSTGRLVKPFDQILTADGGYWIIPPPGGLTAPGRAFADWLRAEMAHAGPR
ncbi:LysR family transcriptional regulator [Alphaproteobacteria bacterium KMM 3653]|uniref:LysR family transcriptional regulator n=1 Tax=Harenicola maris TaxID=2841044 RepID=A0AAP2CQZ1_9RHOB|nr:LysR family transcriptional regulator [Harenicola maris]